jgi:hypothetical protein
MTWIVFDYGEVIALRPDREAFARLAGIAGAPEAEFQDAY